MITEIQGNRALSWIVMTKAISYHQGMAIIHQGTTMKAPEKMLFDFEIT